MKTSGKRLLSMLLALLMVLSIFPAAAFAEESEEIAPTALETEAEAQTDIPAPMIEEESTEESIPDLFASDVSTQVDEAEPPEDVQPDEDAMTLAGVPDVIGGDDDYVFTLQPQSGSIDPATLRYEVTWETNFVPLVIELLDSSEQGYYARLDPTETAGSCSWPVTNVGGPFHIRAWYATGQSISSEEFYVYNDQLAFISQPQNTNIDPATREYTVTWETNFVPSAVYFIKQPSKQELGHLDMTTMDGEKSFSAWEKGSTLTLRAYYSLGKYVESETFTLVDYDFHFSIQPQSGSYSPDTLNYEAVWETNFIPCKVEVRQFRADSSSSFVLETFEEPTGFSGAYPFPFKSASKTCCIYAYYTSTDYVASDPFTVDDANIRFTSQPQNGSYDPESGEYAVQWGTSFTPKKVEVCHFQKRYQYDFDPERIVDVSLTDDLSPVGICPIPTSCGAHEFLILAYYGTEEEQFITSEPFTVGLEDICFVVQPRSGLYGESYPESPYYYYASWETSFVPTRIEVCRFADTIPGHYTALFIDDVVANITKPELLDRACAYLMPVSLGAHAYCIRAYYDEDNYISSDSFVVTTDGLTFTESPFVYYYDTETGEYMIRWETSFIPTKVVVSHLEYPHTGVTAQIPEVVVDKTLTSGYDTTGYCSFPAEFDTYYVHAYYGEESTDFIERTIYAGTQRLSFNQSPESGVFDAATRAFAFSSELNFIPLKVEIWKNNEVTDTVEAPETGLSGSGVVFNGSIPVLSGEGEYYLRAFYGPLIGECVDSAHFTVEYPGPMFTVIPEAGAASLETPHEIHWATSFEPTQLELCCIENGVHVTLGTLNSAATAFAIPYDMAAAHRDALFYIRAWFGEGEEDFITTPGFSVALRLELDGLTIDALGTTHAFTPSEWDAEAYAYLTYSNNALSSGAVQYRIDFGSGTNTWIELALLDPNGTDCLTLYIDNWNVENETLPRSLVTLDQEANEIEINTSIPYLRQLFHSYAEQHGLENPDLFNLKLVVYSSGGGASFLMRDLHLPLPIEGPYIDFDSFTLTTPLTPELVFPDGAPAVTAVNSECYAVIGTVGNVWLQDGETYTPLYPDPAPVYESEDEAWQSYFYNTWHEVGDEYVPYPAAERFQYYFGEGYNRWVTGPGNPAPRGPANYIYGVTANHLTRSGTDLASTAICLADFMSAENETYFNSLPGLSHYCWLGYFEEDEKPEDWEEVYYELLGAADSAISVTFADGVTYRGTIPLFNNMGGEGDFHVVGEPYIPPSVTLHTAAVVFDGLIRIKYYYTIPESLRNQEGAAIVFYKNGAEVTRTPLSEGVLVTGGKHAGQCSYYYDVVASEIRTPVTVRILDADGNLVRVLSSNGTDYTEGLTYSVQTYAENMQDHGSAKIKPLAKALEDYGIAAALYFGTGDASALAVSEEVQAVTAADLLPYALTSEGTRPAGHTGCSISVMFEADNSLRIYFKFDGTKSPDSYTYLVDGQPATLHERSDGARYLTVQNIAAPDLGTAHTFTISDGTDSYTATASVLSYARTSILNGNEARQNLGKALYLYYLAAQQYFG